DLILASQSVALFLIATSCSLPMRRWVSSISVTGGAVGRGGSPPADLASAINVGKNSPARTPSSPLLHEMPADWNNLRRINRSLTESVACSTLNSDFAILF